MTGDDFFFWLLCGLIGLIMLLTGLVIYGAIVESLSPTFTLTKNQWRCSASHTQITQGMILVGKTMVPTSNVSTICDNYERAR